MLINVIIDRVAASMKEYGSSSTTPSACLVTGKPSRTMRRRISHAIASSRNLWGRTTIIVCLSDLHVTAKISSKNTNAIKTLVRAKLTQLTPSCRDIRKIQKKKGTPTINVRKMKTLRFCQA